MLFTDDRSKNFYFPRRRKNCFANARFTALVAVNVNDPTDDTFVASAVQVFSGMVRFVLINKV
jgi:hypothetical protein